MPVSQAYQWIARIAFSGLKGERPAPKSSALPTSLYPDIQFLPLYHDGEENQRYFCLWSFLWSKPLLCRFRQPEESPLSPVPQGFSTFRHALSRIPPRHSQSKRATNCANPGYEIQTDPTAGCSNSGVCLQMATPQNLTAVHVACRKRTECRRKTILYFTEICRKVKSYIEEAPCPYGHGALILATAAAIAATAVVAAAPTAAAAAAPDDDQQNDDPAAVPAASATVITAHIGTSYEIEM